MSTAAETKARGVYRSRDGMFAGVCKGIAEYLDFSVFWTRVLAIVACLFTGFWPVIVLYVIAALLMKPEPVMPLSTDEDAEFYHSYAASREMALNRLKNTFDRLNRRLQRLEHVITTREYDWERRLRDD
jgi:phage shock protein C